MASIATLWFVSMSSIFLSVFWLNIFFRGDAGDGKKASAKSVFGKELPWVSIIVPAYNEEKRIAKCLDSLLALDYPRKKMEIIVSNDGSTDGTEKIAKSYERLGVHVISKKRGGKGSALNAGIRKSTGEFIVCMDADSMAEKNTLKKMMLRFDSEDVAAVTAAMKIHNPKTLIQRMQNVEYTLAIFLRHLMGRIDTIQVTPGPFSIYRRSILDKIGCYFDEKSLVEDTEIAYRIHKNGYLIKNVVDAYVLTSSPENFNSLKNQRVRWYRGLYRLTKDYKELVLNPKYGNFGIFQLPMMIFSIFLLFLSLYLYFSTALEYVWRQASIVGLVGLDYYVPDWSEFFKFRPLMTINFLFLFPMVSVFIVGMYVLRLAYKVSKEKMRSDALNLVPYVLFYYPMLAIFWLIAVSKELTGAKRKW